MLAVVLALTALAPTPRATAAGTGIAQTDGTIAVGVRYAGSDDAVRQRRDLEEMQRLRFTVVEHDPDGHGPGRPEMLSIDRLLAGAPDARVQSAAAARPPTVVVSPGATAAEVAAHAWAAFAEGTGIVFADWTSLVANGDALGAATDFAAAVARNSALYAPLRPVAADARERGLRVQGGGDAFTARLLESGDALVLIAVNRAARPQSVVMAFSADVPEAIWQNMLTGSAVNFVSGPDGPVYERAFGPHEVLVLAIRTSRR